jgi:phage nucleotide-binding protein
LKVLSTKDIQVSNLKMVVFGAAGAGKTVLCSTAPKPLIISSEGGLLSLRGLDVPYVEIKTANDLNSAYEMARKSDYQSICIDSLSEVAESLLVELKKGVNDPRQAYGQLAEAMMIMMRKFRDLPDKHVIYTAKQEIKTDESTGSMIIRPIMPGQLLPTQLPYLMDLVCHLSVDKKGERKLQTKADRTKVAKDRSGKLDDFEPANIQHLITKIGS